MKRYHFSPLYSINCKSFSKWIRLKGSSDSQGDAPDTDKTLDKGERTGHTNLSGHFKSIKIDSNEGRCVSNPELTYCLRSHILENWTRHTVSLISLQCHGWLSEFQLKMEVESKQAGLSAVLLFLTGTCKFINWGVFTKQDSNML